MKLDKTQIEDESTAVRPNDLRRILESHRGAEVAKWDHYIDIYERYFSRYRGTDVHLLEVGVGQGGSLQMWKRYFGERAHIFGVDIDQKCKVLEESQIRIFIGDQADCRFLRRLTNEIPRIDIVIDDGGHQMYEQIATFETLYPHVSPYGLYLCEDTHTSYRKRFYGGGYGRRGTFIEYAKQLIDQLHAWHSEEPHKLRVSHFTDMTYALHFYDSVLVVEKRPKHPPTRLTVGHTVVSRRDVTSRPTARLIRALRRCANRLRRR